MSLHYLNGAEAPRGAVQHGLGRVASAREQRSDLLDQVGADRSEPRDPAGVQQRVQLVAILWCIHAAPEAVVLEHAKLIVRGESLERCTLQDAIVFFGQVVE